MTPEEQVALEAQRKRSRNYQAAFAHPIAQEMLQDLAVYCRGSVSAAPEVEGEPFDLHRTLIILGRQQVWLRIINHLNLQPSQLFALYQRRPFQVRIEDEDEI